MPAFIEIERQTYKIRANNYVRPRFKYIFLLTDINQNHSYWRTHDILLRLLLRQLPWHFVVGEGGKVVAMLQDTVLEIRTSRDEYSSVVGMASSKWPLMIYMYMYICVYVVICSNLYSIYCITQFTQTFLKNCPYEECRYITGARICGNDYYYGKFYTLLNLFVKTTRSAYSMLKILCIPHQFKNNM